MRPAIDELEQLAALGWRAPEEAQLGAWLLRAARGFTGRANSALAIGDPGRPLHEAVSVVCRWYQARQLPPMIAIPRPLDGQDQRGLDRLLVRWRIRQGPTVVMTAPATQAARHISRRASSFAGEAALAGRPEFAGQPAFAGQPELAAEPDDAWLSLYNYRGRPLPPIARQLLLSAPDQVFATIRDGAAPVAIGRLALACGWGGLTAVEVRPDQRRQGLGTAITATLVAAAVARGVTRMYLQVEERNTAAVALYERCGFASHHRYHYRIAPG